MFHNQSFPLPTPSQHLTHLDDLKLCIFLQNPFFHSLQILTFRNLISLTPQARPLPVSPSLFLPSVTTALAILTSHLHAHHLLYDLCSKVLQPTVSPSKPRASISGLGILYHNPPPYRHLPQCQRRHLPLCRANVGLEFVFRRICCI